MKFLAYNTQGINIVTGAIFALVLVGKVQGTILTDSFRKIAASHDVVSGIMTSALSKLRCATMCSKDDTCTSFAYNRAAKSCEMSEKVIDGPGKDIYVNKIIDINECDSAPCKNNGTCEDRFNDYFCNCAAGFTGINCSNEINECDSAPCENNGICEDRVNDYFCSCAVGFKGKNCAFASCPTNKGYKVWIYPDMNLCIRYKVSRVDQQDARSQCEADGGHLVLIENDKMRLHLNTIASSLGVSKKDRTYLDGIDINGNDVFTDWKGGEAWLSWAPSNTISSSENCLSTRLKDEFRHWDYTCSNTCDYLLCQIDI